MIINLHTHKPSLEKNVRSIQNVIIDQAFVNAEDNEKLFDENKIYSIGVHPWFIDKDIIDEQLALVENYGQLKNVKAIGEIGLDKLKEPDFKTQELVFLAQIRIAERLNKPVIIHAVKSFNELIGIQKIVRPKIPMIIHGFNKKTEIALELIKKGFNLSFGSGLLSDVTLCNTLKQIPINQLFFETDDSDYSITDIYKKAAEILEMEIQKLEELIYENYLSIFI